jgi:CheY-like chemotaxis protein
MFAGRIRGTAGAAGRSVVLARRPQEVLDAVRAGAVRVLLDLDARSVDVPALIRALREDAATRHAEIIAWVSHVRTDAIAEAREAGADRVLARSAFVRELPALLD